ncbi:MAG: ion transporter [Gammaproteobacteria bacterium]
MNRTVSTWRQRAFELLEQDRADTRAAKTLRSLLIALIVANVVAVILESVPDYARSHGRWFAIVEFISVMIFTLEYATRIWSCVQRPAQTVHSALGVRLRYAITPLALVDLIAIAPFYIAVFVGLDLRVLRVLRLLRMLKLTRYFTALGLLADALRAEGRAFGAAFVVMCILMLLAASAMHLAEHAVQPAAFGSIPAAMWWAIVTLTTVGYGDVVPATTAGKIIGASIMILGIGMVALPAGMLASRFSSELHRRRQLFRASVERALQDGMISHSERAVLDEKRHALCLSEAEASSAIDAALAERGAWDVQRCPHCGRDIGPSPPAP